MIWAAIVVGMVLCALVGGWAYSESAKEREDLRVAAADLGVELDKALGLTRFVAWLNGRLERVPGLRSR